MTKELYIYERHNHYIISKSIEGKTRTWGHFYSLDEAIFARELFISHEWNLDEIRKLGNVIKYGDQYLVAFIYNDQLRFLGRFDTFDDAEANSQNLINEYVKNPYGGKYGLYISKRYDYFDIRRRVDGNDVLYAILNSLEDATFARDLLMEHDWDLMNILKAGPIFYSQVHDDYAVVIVNNDRLVVVKHFKNREEAAINAQDAIENYKKSRYSTGEKYVVFNGNLFAVHHPGTDKKIDYYGSFAEKIDAVIVRDILEECDWDMSRIDENKIYESNGYFLKLHVFEGRVKIIGKYKSLDFARKDIANLATVSMDSLYDPENPYSKANRYIWKRGEEFYIRKTINGEVQFIGPYDSREDAIEARDRFESNDWMIAHDEESIFSSAADEDYFANTVSGLNMWQKIVYDTIDRLGKEKFSFEELINHSFIKRYKSGGDFEDKVNKHLSELVELGLVRQLDDGEYLKLF